MDPVRALTDLGGAGRPETLHAMGVTRGALLRAVKDGRATRPRYGVYALPGATRDAVLGASYRADLSCLSLCRALGLPVIEDDRHVHLAIPRNRARRADDRRPIAGVVLHRHDHEGGAAGEVSRGLDLLGACSGRMQQLVALDAALHRGLVRVAMLSTWTHTAPERRDWLAAHCDGRAQSHLETITRITLVEERLSVEPQKWVPGLGHVDLMIEGRLIVETDGASFHDNPRAWREDLRRNNAAARSGYPVLRFSYADVMGDRRALVAAVKETLGLPL